MNNDQKIIARAFIAIYTEYKGIAASTDRDVYPLIGLLPAEAGTEFLRAINPVGNKYSITHQRADELRAKYELEG